MNNLSFLRFIVLCTLILTSFILVAQNQIVGKWLTEDKEAHIEIYRNAKGELEGKIVWLKQPDDEKGKPFTDTKNPDAKLRHQPLIGLVIIKNLVADEQKWKGNIYDPDTGKMYHCSLWVEDNRLKMRGYVGFFYQTETWTKL